MIEIHCKRHIKDSYSFTTIQYEFLTLNLTAIFRDTSCKPVFQFVENVPKFLLSDFMNCLLDPDVKFI
jgi:hypothetical protein